MLTIRKTNDGRYAVTHPETGVVFACAPGDHLRWIDEFLPLCDDIVFA